jgi:secondary thiamine-phosphate synthase enzyme
MKVFEIHTSKREELIPITKKVQDVIKESGIKNGMCVLFVPHTTAALTINENADPDVKMDILSFLNEKIPKSASFRHFEGNSDAHIKSSLIGPSLALIIENGDIVLGRWQDIYFFEGDGPRNRKIYMQIIEGN